MKNANWKAPVIIGVGVIAVILMIIFGVQSSQNKAIALEEQVNTAQSDIKVQEKRRVDLIYNLTDCVKQYDKHEADTLAAVEDKFLQNINVVYDFIKKLQQNINDDIQYVRDQAFFEEQLNAESYEPFAILREANKLM